MTGVQTCALPISPPLKDQVRGIITGPGTDGPDGSRADLVRRVHNIQRRLAVDQLRQESPDLGAAMDEKLRERIQRKVPSSSGSPVDALIKSLTP